MATYQFSALSDGQALSFSPSADVLNFDQSAIAAADIRVTASGASTRIDVIAGPHAGKDILLLNTSPSQLATANVTFADGSRLLIGDSLPGTGDEAGNTLAGSAGRDLILGLGGSDTINIGAASFGAGDHIDGGAGFDTLNFNGYVTAALAVDFVAGTIASSAGSATFTGIERLIGGAGNDSIAGDAAGQNLTSVGGNDTLWGAGGVDTLWSGTGADVFLFREVGTANADTIGDFASGADRIVLDGAVLGGLGPAGTFAAADPRFWAAAGATGGHDADDRVVYNTTTRQLFYDADGNGAGAAQLIATLQSGATLAATDIEIIGSSLPPPPPAPIVGTEGNDSLVGTSGNDTIEGRGGNDTIDGAAGRDTLDGGVGADSFRIAQAPAADLSNLDQYVAFESGLDKLRFDGRAFTQLGLSGNFTVGDERFHAAPGATSGHDATDRLIYDTSTGRLYYDPDGSGTAAPIPIADLYDRAGAPSALAASDIALDNGSAPPPSGQVINGTAAGETLAGTAGTDIINAFGGSDTINIGAASFGAGDAIDGGAGFDTLSFSGYVTAALTMDFAGGTIASSAGSATFTGIERLIGGAGNDSIAGDAAGQNLTSVGGNDTLWGAGGVDTLWSGTGADVFLFREVGTANADTIGDFTSGADRIVLDGAVLAGLGTAGTFAPGDARFWAAAGASGGHDADDRVVYNTTTRQLFYDADGSGAGAAQLIATLQSGATLAATDIEILGSSVPPPPAPIVGTEGNDSLVGTSGNDTIEGRGGNDTLDGAAGADTLDGGAGDDLYLVDNAGDVVVELQNGGIDTVQASLSYALGAWVENLTLTGAAPIAATGNALDNVLIGNGAANTLDGGLGNDTYHAGAGDVLLDAGGTDTVLSGVTWTLGAAFEHLTLTGAGAIDGHGNALANAIQGNGATNVLDGGAGNDTLNGAAGADAFLFHETGAANADTIGDFTSGADRIALDGAALSGLGAAGTFAAGDARFWSAAGATGGHDADDRIVYNTTTRQLFYDVDGSGSGTAQLLATLQSGATLAATDIEVIGLSAPVPIVGTEGNDSLVGTSGNDTLEGRGGNDTLDGAAGADTMDGGAGGDLYLVDNAGDVVVELQNGGIDTVHASLSYTLGSWVENLTLTGGAALAATGNDLDNVITGNGAANTLDGALGNDTYHAGVGDVLFDAGGTDTVVSDVTWTLGAAFENLILTGAAAIHGHGNALANAIQGNGAANVLDGGGGADTLTGGAGGDLYLVGEAGDVVVEQQSGGIDTVQASLSYTLSSWVENLTLIGTAPINATGNELDNVLTGNGAANVLDGGGGADTLDGGAGADLYLVDSTADVVVELQSGGVDTVNAALSYTLGSWVENLTLTGTAPINATGNELDNVLVGNSAANSMDGGLGNDTYHAGSGDVLLDAGGADTVVSNVTWTLGGAFENLSLTGAAAIDGQGNALANAIQGNGGANVLAGGAGNDTLNGGAGADAFLFRESGAANADTIGDFASGSDRIVLDGAALSGLGAAGTFAAGDARFWSAAGATGGHDADDRIVYNTTTRQLFYDVDGSGSGTAQLLATLQSGATLAATDIEVIGLSAPVPIVGTEGNDSLVGTSGNDTIEGRGGNDTLDGAAGADTLDGGAGDDLYLVDNAGDVVVELQNGAIDTVQASLSYALGAWVENLTLTGAAPIAGTGNALDNVLIGNGAANTLDGGLGNDTYHAGAGDVLLDAGGTDTVLSGVTWTLGAAFEHLTLTGAAAIDGHGNALANAIQGNGAANVLDGGGGADTLTGDAGADLYVVDNTGDIVVEQQNGGVDTVNASLSYTLSSWVENLTLIGIAPINATGNELDNVLIGNGAANTLDGGLGNDTYHAGAGDVLVDAGGTDTVLSGVTWTLGAAFEHLTLTGAAAIDAHGNALANAIQGNAGANVLDGGTGNDTLTGGAGADAFVFREGGAASADTIGDFTSGADRIVLDGAGLSGLGAAGSFAAGDARFWAAAGATGGHDVDDRIVYNTTTRQLFYDVDGSGSGTAQLLATLQSGATLLATDIEVIGSSAPVPIVGTEGNDSLVGTSGNDTIEGRGGDDTLDGAAGADTLDGGTGGDLFLVDNTGDVVIEQQNGGVDTVNASLTYTLGLWVENLTLTGTAPITGTGNELNNVLIGNGAANTLDGRAGADTMDGGLGNDTYHASSGDVLQDAGGADVVVSDVTWTLGAAFENLILTGTAAVDGHGNALANAIQGNGASNLLDGGAGADTMDGGAGADMYVVDNAGDVVVELQNGGIDTVNASVSYTLGSQVENLTLTGAAAIDGRGNALANAIQGNGAANVLEGGAGNDILTGGAGADALLFRETGAANADTIGDFASGGDRIVLDAAVLSALGPNGRFAVGDARFFAGPGASGGQDATDRVVYDTASGRLYYDVDGNGAGAAQLIATLQSGATLAATDIEVIGSSVPPPIVGTEGNDSLVGTSGNDTLEGRGGNDTLDGAAGADSLDGGAGGDLYLVDNAGDVVVELQNGGIDAVQASLSYALGAWVENLTLTGAAPIAATGNALDNVLIGNGAANTLDGGLGNDTYHAGAGDVLLDAGGTDTVLSGVTWTLGAAFEHLTLTGAAAIDGHGNALANAIQGNGAANVLEGGAGNDTLNGGAGADAFLFHESGVANADTIGDFASGADRIVLDGVALSGLGAAGSFAAGDARFWSAAGATGGHDADDRIVYNTTTRQLFYDADGSGSGAAQLLATLQSGATLAATDIAVEGGAPPPDSGVRTVVNNGASANRIDIVVLGDGYTAGELATDYTSDVDALVAYLFDDSPLSQPLGRYESFFNVYAVDVASNESGADQGGVNRDTALGAQYSGGSVTLTIDEAAANAVLAGALQGTGIQAEMRFVAVNDARYGGSGGSFAIYSAANSWAPEIALHEAGHHFADLADQYWSPGQRYSGTEPDHPDVTADPAAAKWSRWLGYDEVGIPAVGVYEGGFNYETGIYRPSDTSKMQALGQPFDAVGREAFILEFYALVDPLDGHLGNAQALSNTDELWVDTIDPQIIRVDWTINGTTYSNAGERISLSALGLSNGDYTVSARAYDPTDWVRVADRSSLEQTVEWRVINDTAPRIVGTAANDLLVGGSGNDSLDGGLGADTMNGGLGNDVYVVTAGDVVGDIGGIDTAVSDISWSLGAASGLDNLTLTGTAPIAGQGNSGDNRLLGNGAANTLDGGEGNDAIAGGDGNDVVRVDLTTTATYGDDTVDGGSGNDAIALVGQRSATVLDLRARTLSGGGQSGAGSIAIWSIETFNFSVEMSFADRVIAGDLGIQASTGGGDDTLVGGAGADVWQGGPGADSFVFVRASAAVDTILDFTSGQDELHFDSAAFTGIGASGRFAAGDQRFHAASGATQGHDATDRFVYDTATGNLRYDADGSGPAPAQLVATFSGNAAISATDIVVRLNGTSGRDTLDGGSSDDELHGGADQDFFRFRLGSGDYGHDVIDGGPGVDHLDFTGYAQSAVVVDLRAGTLQGGGPGGAGSASLESIEAVRGGSFDDLLIAPEASEFGGAAFSGGGGNDTLVGGASRDALWGDAGDDQLFGNGGNDQLDGGRGADQILAGAGDDLILVYDFEPAVIDRIDGGPGRDQVQFHAARASLTVNLATGTATVGTSTFMLADVEDIIGPEYASQMTGNAAGNFLAGGGGADTLHGGPGNDTLLGGGGADSFLFAEASGSANADLIPDFAPGSDRIRLDDAAFTGIGATGGFVAGDARFAAGAGFTAGRDASDRVVYDTATGNLYYDADGSGAGAAQLIATFTGNPGIAATDIVVI